VNALDKEEFRIKLEEINKLVQDKDYKGAMNIVDSIDWRRVKNVRTLCVVGEIYAANGRYEDSKEIFLLAYHKASIGKNILYRLIEISLRMDDINEAEEFFEEYKQVASNDSTQYILQYKIARAKNSSLNEQIRILEEYKEQEFTVEGLEEVKEVDPFEDIEVTFSGTPPYVYPNWTNNSDDDYLRYLWFNFEDYDSLDVGDTVTLTVDESEENALANGYKFTQTSKEYIVSGVDSYVTSAADISADNLDSMKNEATDVLDAYFANNNSYIGNSGFSYEGSYYLVAKNSDTWGDTNVLYLVFSTTVTSAENAFEPTVVYFPVKYTNIMALSDGSQSFNTYGDIEGYTDLEYDDGWYNVDGYTDGAQMFNDLVVTQKVDYTYEVTDNLTQFGN